MLRRTKWSHSGLYVARCLSIVAWVLAFPTVILAGEPHAQRHASIPATWELVVPVRQANPIPAWTDFCKRYPTECALDLSQPATITLTGAVWSAILEVNRRVNKSIKSLPDHEHWGVADRWDIPEDGYGDCEDFQLLKRKLLAEHGLPRRAMRMTVVIDDRGEGHAVLMIRTDKGDFILDNKTSAVLPWSKTGYTFVKREGHDSMAWLSLGGVISPVATANR
jgi:predicted transglutaminase-like cysteine proteinase